MVPLPSAESSEVNAVETIERLTHSHTSKNHQNDTCLQPIYSQASLTNNSTSNSPQNSATQPHDQSTVSLQQFSMITQDLRKFMDKVSCDITKNIQAYTTAQENTGKLLENMISQALTKSQDSTPPNPTLNSRSNQASNSSYEANWTLSWLTSNYIMQKQSNNDTFYIERPYGTCTSAQACENQQSLN